MHNTTSGNAPQRLAYPAPQREWYRTEAGFASRPWTKESKARYIEEAGAWFGSYDRAEEDER